MKRLKWRCHRKLLQGHCTKFKVKQSQSADDIVNLDSHMTLWTTLSSDPGGTAPAMKQPWQMLARYSRRVQLPPGRHGHRVWRVLLTARSVSASQQTAVVEVAQHRRIGGETQRDKTALYQALWLGPGVLTANANVAQVSSLSACCSPIFLFQACIFLNFQIGALGPPGLLLSTSMLQPRRRLQKSP